MSKEQDNKALVGRWFTEFWGSTCNLNIVDELAAPDMLLRYSLHEPRRGREDIKAFMSGFREAFPDLNFWGAADLIAEGDYVVGRWEGGGTHTGPGVRRLSDRVAAGRYGTQDAFHRNDGTSYRKRQNRGGDWIGRRGDCATAAPIDPRNLVTAAAVAPATAAVYGYICPGSTYEDLNGPAATAFFA